MVIDSPAYKKAIQRLWTGKATVYVRVGALNPTTSATEQPCRLSHKTVKNTEPAEEAAQVTQTTVLYIDPSVEIPEGSKVTVTQNGVTRDYGRSGTPAVYTSHQEVPLELWKGWA